MNHQKRIANSSVTQLFLVVVFSLAILLSLSKDEPSPSRRPVASEVVPADCSVPASQSWVEKINRIRWVTYSSPNPNPDQGFYQPTAETIYQDLTALRKAQFTGLITYASAGIMGKQFLDIAQSLGFKGIIMGIWSPTNQDELNNAKSAASSPIVLGYSIGNEALSGARDRYSISGLCSAISDLRTSTGRPVSTSEDIETYYWRPELLSVGDWLFPIAHPYWHFIKYPQDAIQWEQTQYAALLDKTNRFVFFKEVGLPTAGAFGLSETNQDLYYRGLAETDVRFAYFEAFDQSSKIHASIEPYWGIFHSNLDPKLLAWNLMGYRLFTSDNTSNNWTQECSGSSGKDCSDNTNGTMLLVGKGLRDREYRSFLEFNTSGLPDNAIITSVKLKVKAMSAVGINPLNNQHDLMVDICTLPVDKTIRYQMLNFRVGLTCNNNLGGFGKTPNSGRYIADFSPGAFQSVNLTGVTRFRLRISELENIDAARAYLMLDSGGVGYPNSPILLVRYTIPDFK